MAGFGGGWDAPTPPNFGNAAIVAGSVTVVGPNGPNSAFLPGAPTIPTPSGIATGEVWDWGGAVFNVKTANALVDGATDDLVAQQAVGTALGGVGGIVQEVPGVSLISDRWIAPTKAFVAGAGRAATTIKLKDSANIAHAIIESNADSTFAHFTIDGNKANQASGRAALELDTTKQIVFAVRTVNPFGRGFFQFGGSDSLFLGVESEGAGGDSITLFQANTRTRIIGSRLDGSADNGILSGGTSVTRRVVGFNIINAPGQIGIATGSGNKEITVGNYIQASHDNAIDFAGGSDILIANNLGEAPGAGVIGDASALVYPAFQSAVLVVGNVMGSTTAAGLTPGYGYGVSGQDGVFNSNIGHDLAGHGMTLFSTINTVVVGNLLKNITSPNSAFRIDAGVGGALLVANRAFDDRNLTPGVSYGINVALGARWVNLFHNDVRGTNSLNPLNVPDISGVYTHGNPGYNPRGVVTLALPAIGTLFTPPGNGDGFVVITGGTVTNISVGGLPAPANWPTQPTLASVATGGTLAGSTTYAYRVAARNTAGHTVECAEVTIAVGAGTNTNRVTITLPALAGSWSFDIYGRTSGGELLMASNWAKSTFIDDGSVTPSGAMPGTDTTGNTALGVVPPVVLPFYFGVAMKFTGTVNPTCTWWQN